MKRQGVLWINLGSPSQPTYWGIRNFLSEFLSDARVIDLPFFLRYALLYGAILPFRPFKTQKSYQSIWTKEGSPLISLSTTFLASMQQRFQDLPMALGMRYGEPSLRAALDSLHKQGVNEIIVVSLYPQYATSSSASSLAAVYELAAQYRDPPSLWVKGDFYQDEGYLQAQAHLAQPYLKQESWDLVVMSFHGVPVRHLIKSGCAQATQCQEQICPIPKASCYRSQCMFTAKQIHARLNTRIPYEVVFQSRLGRLPWIKPYLDAKLEEWAAAGKKNILLMSPSFAVDCLETLEELGAETKHHWEKLTGGVLQVVPCLNDHEIWLNVLEAWLTKTLAFDHSLPSPISMFQKGSHPEEFHLPPLSLEVEP